MSVLSLLKLRRIRRAGLAALIALAVAASLWSAAPTQALDITLPVLPAAGTLGSSYSFSVRIDIADGELVPIAEATLYIYKADDRATYQATCLALPLNPGSRSYSDAQTLGGGVEVTVAAEPDWAYAYGYGNATWLGGGYRFFPPTGYGYGYGGGATSITYGITWNPPAAWPAGSYQVEVRVSAGSHAFSHTSTLFSLGAAGGGGGGGGGGPPPGFTYFAEEMSGGIFVADATARSPDGLAYALFAKGTRFLTRQGFPGNFVSVVEMSPEEQPPAPEEGSLIGRAYNLGPGGATFEPPISLTFILPTLPPDIDPDSLAIGYWDELAQAWVVLEGAEPDLAAGTITVPVSHFSIFAVLGYRGPAPASFNLSGLSITPAQVSVGNEVLITVSVTNSGEAAGTLKVPLQIDGITVATREVTLAGNMSETVTFTTSPTSAREYNVNIEGLRGSFVALSRPGASFTVKNLVLTPAVAAIGEGITLSVQVTNITDTTASYEVILKVNGVIEEKRQVSPAARATETVTFNLPSKVAGSYQLDINGLSGTITVKDRFEVGNLSFTPAVADVGEEITVRVLAANLNSAPGTYTLVLNVDGAASATRQVSLAAKASETVSFRITPTAPGAHSVEVGGVPGTFIVREPAAPAPVRSSVNWWLLGGVLGALALAISALVVVRRQRERASGGDSPVT